jgi:hypothetical protein
VSDFDDARTRQQAEFMETVPLRELLESKLDVIAETLRRVEVQTTATNGRVLALERWQTELIAGERQLSKDVNERNRTDQIARSWTQPIVTGLVVGVTVGLVLFIIALAVPGAGPG